MKFDHIIDAIITSGWLQSHQAYLVDDSGKVLMSTFSNSHDRLGYHDDPLEQETLMEMKKKPFGTLIGQRHSASEVSGFYRLNEAPWNLVMFAPASEILAPISRFQRYHLAMVIVFIVLILLLIRFVVGRAADSIKEVSKAAVEVSHGEYSITLPVKTQDEIGELTRSFNTMILQLEERSRLKAALSLARDVQQNLIPRTTPSVRGIDVAAKIIYCEETGGDYYDFIEFDASNQQKLGVVLGDVSDHGIPSALLMATVRSSIRQRAFMPGSIAQIVSDVNRQLAHDVVDSGQFMTLFFLLIDPQKECCTGSEQATTRGSFMIRDQRPSKALKGTASPSVSMRTGRMKKTGNPESEKGRSSLWARTASGKPKTRKARCSEKRRLPESFRKTPIKVPPTSWKRSSTGWRSFGKEKNSKMTLHSL